MRNRRRLQGATYFTQEQRAPLTVTRHPSPQTRFAASLQDAHAAAGSKYARFSTANRLCLELAAACTVAMRIAATVTCRG
jgi:hypothetical protein